MKPSHLVIAGLAAQAVGVFTQGLWHAVLADSGSGLLTEDRTFLIDHTISNLGVACMVAGAWQLHRQQFPAGASRVVVAGTALEVLGAIGDMLSHLSGSESPVAFGLIGTGFITVTAGLILDAKRTQRTQSEHASTGKE